MELVSRIATWVNPVTESSKSNYSHLKKGKERIRSNNQPPPAGHDNGHNRLTWDRLFVLPSECSFIIRHAEFLRSFPFEYEYGLSHLFTIATTHQAVNDINTYGTPRYAKGDSSRTNDRRDIFVDWTPTLPGWLSAWRQMSQDQNRGRVASVDDYSESQ